MWTVDLSKVITAEQQAAEATAALWTTLRAERDRLLTGSDWTQLPDVPVDVAAWAIYRQVLRELPDVTADPSAPLWPDEPAR